MLTLEDLNDLRRLAFVLYQEQLRAIDRVVALLGCDDGSRSPDRNTGAFCRTPKPEGAAR